MATIYSGDERPCAVPACNGRMKAGVEIQGDFPPPGHVWQCTQDPGHTENRPDAEIREDDLIRPS